MRSKEDRRKIFILRIVIIVITILIITFTLFFIMTLINNKNKKGQDLSTTARRTIETTERTTITQNEDDDYNEEGEHSTTTTTEVTVSTTSTQEKSYVSSSSTSQSGSYQEQTTATTTAKVHNVVTNASTYSNAVDNWEWNVVNSINATRAKNGLNALKVDGDYRTKAEESANKWSELTSAEFKENLKGYNYFASWDQDLPSSVGARVFYNETVNGTDITTNKNLSYVGVGIVYKISSTTGNVTYYYVIIYE